MKKVQEGLEEQQERAFLDKIQKQQKMQEYCDEGVAWKQKFQNELKNEKLAEKYDHFPFTHSNNVEEGRAAIQKELYQDMKNFAALKERMHRQKIGEEIYDKNYKNTDNPVIEHESKLYPQGGYKQVQLRDTFSKETPFFLKANKPVFCRKLPQNQAYYDSAMEDARRRFESDLRSKQAENNRHKNEHITQLEESNKFVELKKLKDRQKSQL